MSDRIGGYQRPTSTSFISSSQPDHKRRVPPSQEPGTDYAAPYGSALYAAEDGVVAAVQSSTSGATGRFITLDLDDGYRVRYLHLAVIAVTVGQRVSRGQIIGKTGASAWGKDWGVGAHVHTSLFNGHTYNGFGPGSTLDFEAYVGPDNDGGTVGRGGFADGSEELRRFQSKLIQMGHDLGAAGADAKYGPMTAAATLHEQRMAERNGYPGGNVADDSIPGPSTEAYLDWWIVGRHQNQGHNATVNDIASLPNKRGLQKVANLYLPPGGKTALDNDWGPKSKKGLQTFLDRNYRGSLPQWLRVKYGYVGDDVWGPVMAAAATRADAANWHAL